MEPGTWPVGYFASIGHMQQKHRCPVIVDVRFVGNFFLSAQLLDTCVLQGKASFIIILTMLE